MEGHIKVAVGWTQTPQHVTRHGDLVGLGGGSGSHGAEELSAAGLESADVWLVGAKSVIVGGGEARG